jgi:flagellar basal-body rod protein FlgF
LGRLLVVGSDNPLNMVREGHDLFRWEGQGELAAAGAAELRQGFLERSNVDPVETSVQMMSAMRAYEANQKIIQFYDRSLDKAVNEVGRV